MADRTSSIREDTKNVESKAFGQFCNCSAATVEHLEVVCASRRLVRMVNIIMLISTVHTFVFLYLLLLLGFISCIEKPFALEALILVL